MKLTLTDLREEHNSLVKEEYKIVDNTFIWEWAYICGNYEGSYNYIEIEATETLSGNIETIGLTKYIHLLKEPSL